MSDWFVLVLTHPIVLLSLGGGAGANARYWIGRAVANWQELLEFPWATFGINVVGSALLGLIAGCFLNHPDPARRNWYVLLGTGFCGGFTTFSAFSLETLELIRDGKHAWALGYVTGSVLAGLAGAWLGLRLMGK